MVPASESEPPPSTPGSDAEERLARLEALEPLVRGAAHDVNNVIGVVLGYVELARMGLDEEHAKTHHFLAQALKSVDRAREIADGLLTAARDRPRDPTLCAPGPAVEEACALLARMLDPRVHIEMTLAPEAPVTPLDGPDLRRVLLHLGTWAAEAMPHGGRLAVALDGVEVADGDALAPGTYARLRVGDSAPEPRTVDGEPRLAVVRTLAERHGGGLVARAAPEGSTVEVWLPSALRVPSAPPARPSPGLAGSVLVADADGDARRVLRGYLEGEGLEVGDADSGAAVEAALEAGGFGLVLLDERLPDVSGSDLAWRVAKRRIPPRIVVMGAGGALPAGAHRLPKPFLRADLAHTLREVFGGAASG